MTKKKKKKKKKKLFTKMSTLEKKPHKVIIQMQIGLEIGLFTKCIALIKFSYDLLFLLGYGNTKTNIHMYVVIYIYKERSTYSYI